MDGAADRCCRVSGGAVQVKMRFTVAEEAELQTMARAAGFSVAAFVRKRAMGIPVVPPRANGRRRSHELNRVGNNLNQIAHHLNAGRDGEHRCAASTRRSEERRPWPLACRDRGSTSKMERGGSE